jgi:hypothetical protein
MNAASASGSGHGCTGRIGGFASGIGGLASRRKESAQASYLGQQTGNVLPRGCHEILIGRIGTDHFNVVASS